jgi:hypothetical protein
MLAQMMWYEDEDMTEYEVEPMCSMLYQLAGKCNEHFNTDSSYGYSNYNDQQDEEEGWEQYYQSEQQMANEAAVCSFLESIKSNSYDENGQVVLTSNAWSNPTQWGSEFQAESKVLDSGTKAAISLLTIAVAVMGVWACFLHGTLARKNIPWRPRRKADHLDPTDLARQNSGIVMGRSRSGPNTNLI